MSTTLERIDQCRRQFLSTAATGIAVIGATSLLSTNLVAAAEGDDVRAFRANAPEEQIVDLRRRIAATRWPDRETANDGSQGIELVRLQELVRYWGTAYEWRRGEARLNALPQFMTTIDDVDIHFIHVRSRHPNALPRSGLQHRHGGSGR